MRDSQIVNYSYSFSREDQTLRVTDKSPVFSVLKDGVCIDEGLVREYFENVGQLLFEVTENVISIVLTAVTVRTIISQKYGRCILRVICNGILRKN